jgi:hypothetical protein
MDVADVYDWFAKESMEAGKQATEWKQRETFLRSALMWAKAAQQSRKGSSTLSAISASTPRTATSASSLSTAPRTALHVR